MTLQVHGDLLAVVLLTTLRVSAFLVVAPPFSGRGIPARVKAALSFALALPVAPMLRSQAPQLELGPLLNAALYQVVVGLSMGFVVYLFVSVVQAAGSLVDLTSGFALAALYDPLSEASSSVFGRIHNLVAITLLFAMNGHLLVLRGVLTTFELLPVRPLAFGDLGRLVSQDVGRFLAAALQIAAPVLVVLFLAELALGLLSKAVPTLNIFSVSFPVKILLAIGLAGIAFALLPGGLSMLMDRATRDMMAVARMLGGRP